MIVGKSQVHHGSRDNLAVDNNGSVLDTVETQDGSLGHVDNGSTVEGAKDTTVGDGESATSHVLKSELTITGLGTKVGNGLLNSNDIKRLGVTHNGGDETLGGGNSDRDIDVVLVNNGVTTVGALNGSVDRGNVLHGEGGSLGESTHETKLGTGLLEDLILVELAHLHEAGHVNLVEGGQRGGGVLGLLKTLSDTKSHSVHLDASLTSAASLNGLGLSGGSRSRGSLLGGGGSRSSRGSSRGSLLLRLLLRLLLLHFLLLGLLLGGLLGSSSLGGTTLTGLKLKQGLANFDSIFGVGKELSDGTSERSVDGNVDLIGLNGGDLLIELDEITDLCK